MRFTKVSKNIASIGKSLLQKKKIIIRRLVKKYFYNNSEIKIKQLELKNIKKNIFCYVLSLFTVFIVPINTKKKASLFLNQVKCYKCYYFYIFPDYQIFRISFYIHSVSSATKLISEVPQSGWSRESEPSGSLNTKVIAFRAFQTFNR